MPISKKSRIPERGSKQLRKHRHSQQENFYFITTSCFNKQKLFITKDAVQSVFDCIKWLEKEKCMDCYFAILMSDHLHLIFQLLGRKTVSEVMKGLKGFTGRKIKCLLKLNTPVWQDQFYDHLIRKDEDLVEIMKYCLYNPVWAGLVENPFDYPHWKSKFDLGE